MIKMRALILFAILVTTIADRALFLLVAESFMLPLVLHEGHDQTPRDTTERRYGLHNMRLVAAKSSTNSQ